MHPPGYQVFMYYVQRFLGDTPYILRLPSALAGVLSIWAIYLLGRKLYSRKEALLASALLVGSFPAVYYSQEARAYSLLMLFAILSTYYHVSIFFKLRNNDRKIPYSKVFGYLISACIASYLHYFGLLLVFCQGIFTAAFLIRYKSTWPIWIVIYIALLLAYLPWLPTFFSQLGGASSWIKPPSLFAFYKFIQFAFNGASGVFWLLMLTVTFIYLRYRKEIKLFMFKWETVYLLSWLIVPFFLAYIKSITSTPILSNRNLLIILPALFLLVARFIYSAPCRPKTKLTLALLLCVLFFLTTYVDKAYYTTAKKEQFREMASYVIETDDNYSDQPYIIGYAWNKRYLNYYFDYLGSDLQVTIKGSHCVGESNIQFSSINANRVWILSGHKLPDPNVLEKIKKKYELISSREFIRASAYLYKKREH